MKKSGSDRKNIYAEIGPCIQKDHFEIEKKDEHTIKILVFMKETMSIIFKSAEDCELCF